MSSSLSTKLLSLPTLRSSSRKEMGLTPNIYILHENKEWLAPLEAALGEQGLSYREWFIHEGMIDLSSPPPPGVFYNRMSASSHTRGHRYAPELTASVLAWLESHDRAVLNGLRALQLEVNKVLQYQALESVGVKVPRTIAAVGKKAIWEAASHFTGSFISKHNRGGKGLGVQLFHSTKSLRKHLESEDFEPSLDGVTLLQEYIESPDQSITRVEFVGRELLYAVRVDTSEGFELCPADSCQIGDAFCPASEGLGKRNKFEIISNFESDLIWRYQRLMKNWDVDIAAFEFINDREGNVYTYDINTNTNYNSSAEADGPRGMSKIAEYLGSLLVKRNTEQLPTKLSA